MKKKVRHDTFQINTNMTKTYDSVRRDYVMKKLYGEDFVEVRKLPVEKLSKLEAFYGRS